MKISVFFKDFLETFSEFHKAKLNKKLNAMLTICWGE